MSVRHYRSKEWIYVQKEMISNFQSLVTDYFIEQRHREHNLLLDSVPFILFIISSQ